MRASTDSLHLSYSTKRLSVSNLERIPRCFGGSRVYFRSECNRRIVKLYSDGKHFLCRHCHRLPYSSKNESQWDCALRQRNKQVKRLNENPELETYMTQKSNGLWWKTYYHLKERAFKSEQYSDAKFIVFTRRLVKIRWMKHALDNTWLLDLFLMMDKATKWMI
jgi:hypothetical protein